MDAVTRRAWAYLSRVAEPPNPELAQLVCKVGAVEAADLVRRRDRNLDDRLKRSTQARHELDCAESDLDILDRMAGRLVTVDDDEYPGLAFTALRHVTVDDKRPQAHAPLVLWTVGPVSMIDVAERSAALVGTRAASAYGEYVAGDLAVGLVERDVAVVSGGGVVL